MNSKEIADAKKCALSTPDWDAYQIIIRTCLSGISNATEKEKLTEDFIPQTSPFLTENKSTISAP